MDAFHFWIGANLVNVVALGAIMRVFWRRYRKASVLPRADEDVPPSVIRQREQNAIEALIDCAFYGLLALGGVAMIAYATDFWQGPVPKVIPIGTSCIAVVYIGKAALRIWGMRRREEIADLAQREAVELARRLHEAEQQGEGC